MSSFGIHTLHTKVRGRSRFKVDGLKDNTALESALAAGFGRHAGDLRVRASATTGNILVYHAPGRGPSEIATQIAAAVRRWHSVSESLKEPERSWVSQPAAWHLEPWHVMDSHSVLERLGSTTRNGLSRAAARDLLERIGPNTLPQPVARTHARILLQQIGSLPLLLLGAEAVLAGVAGALAQAAVAFTVVGLNVLSGYLIDRRIQQAVLASKRKKRPEALVIRGGRALQLPGEDLVPGDLLLLKPGTYVAADSRVLSAIHLRIDESLLTGESIPVSKVERPMPAEPPLPGEISRSNMVYMGTLVVGGHGMAVVTATGVRTIFGRMQNLLVETMPPRTIMTAKLGMLSRQLLGAGILIGAAGAAIGLLRGLGPLRAAKSAVMLWAMSVPAGLSSAATANLAIGLRRLQARRVVVQRMQALEALGSINIVCFDKTGTITRSRISVIRIFAGRRRVDIEKRRFYSQGQLVAPLQSADLKRLIEVAVLCNESWVEQKKDGRLRFKGSPTEKALLFMGVLARARISEIYRSHRLQQVIQRDEIRRRMITVHRTHDGRQLISVKGDPHEVLQMCARWLVDGHVLPLSDSDRRLVEDENESMAAQGLRVLGLAFALAPQAFVEASSLTETARDASDGANARDPREQEVRGLIWIGLVGIAEPVRKGAATLIGQLHRGGVETVMITGDQSLTAQAVADRVRLSGGRPMKGLDAHSFESMPPGLVDGLIRDVSVFSRVNPSQKLQIVQAYQRAGRTVAMTGDGINDGPALRAADIGIAMGLTGTDVAREVADLVLENDDLARLHDAVLAGRAAQANLKNAARYYLSANFSDAAAALAALTFGVPAPAFDFNILPDLFPGLALLAEDPRPELMDGPAPRLDDALFSRREFTVMGLQAAMVNAGALAAWTLGRLRYGPDGRAGAMAAAALTAAKTLQAYNCRQLPRKGQTGPPPRNRWLDLALAGSIALQALTFFLLPGARSASWLDFGLSLAAAQASFAVSRKLGAAGPTSAVQVNPGQSHATALP